MDSRTFDMDSISAKSTKPVDEHARVMNQPRLLRLHDDNSSPPTPARSCLPLPNELLDIVLEHVIRDNTLSCHDILSFLLTCKACNLPNFKKYIYRTVCFAPDPKSLAVLKDIADDPVRATLVKAMVYKDAAPRALEAAEQEVTGLSYEDREFHRPYTRTRDKSMSLVYVVGRYQSRLNGQVDELGGDLLSPKPQRVFPIRRKTDRQTAVQKLSERRLKPLAIPTY